MFYNLKDKKLKEQEKKGEILHRQLPKKTEKSPVSYRQPSSCLISQIQNTKALLKDRKVTKAGAQEKGQWGKASGGSLCVHVWCAVLFLSLSCPACCVFVSRDSRLAFPVWIMPAHVACVETVEVLSRQEVWAVHTCMGDTEEQEGDAAHCQIGS